MGNGYNHHHLHRQQSFYSKNSFLPILCRVSIKDVRLKDFKDRSSSFSDDPSSPKVGCMGQVKRNSKVIGFPTPYRLTSPATSTTITTTRNNSNPGNLKYTKLKRLFSGRNLMSSNITSTTTTTSTTTNAAAAAAASSCGNSRIGRNGSRRSSKINHDDGNNHVHAEVNISELDPPLPVVKKVQPPPEVNLWKRRSGGMTLKSLQIEQIHQLPNKNYLPAPTL